MSVAEIITQNYNTLAVPCQNEGELHMRPWPYYNSEAGLIEVCLNGTWGYVCDTANNMMYSVVCKQLGFSKFGNNVITHLLTI